MNRVDCTIADMEDILKSRVSASTSTFTICKIAERHEVAFMPSHFSYLQPNGLVWALIKGNVGRQYYLIFWLL